jgi:hypothetical protein
MSSSGPYEGYLGRVTRDYFVATDFMYGTGLRETHNAVLTEMPVQLQQQVQPLLADTRPLGPLTPPIVQQFNRARLGAWGNYLGDMQRRGELAPIEQRREVAIGSSLIMGMLGGVDTVVRDGVAKTPRAVSDFHGALQGAVLLGEEARPTELLALQPQIDALALGRYMHERLGLDNPVRRGAFARDLYTIAAATDEQLTASRNNVESFIHAAAELGTSAASLVLHLTELRDTRKPAISERGREAALALGKLGVWLRHGTQILPALKDRMPTYATAILVRDGGVTTASLREIQETRKALADTAAREGREALRRASDQQKGIFKMAVDLLRLTEVTLPRRGSRRAIDRALQADSFWATP